MIATTLLLLGLLTAPLQEAPPKADPTPPENYAETPAELMPYSAREPYRRLFLSPLKRYRPTLTEPRPEGLESIRIGLFAPLEGTVDDVAGLALLRGARLAIEQANASGGWQGLPFELVVKNDTQLWGSSANTIVDLKYRDKVWAVIGSIDSNSTHVALRVALKCELPIVNVGASDPTLTETGIPWLVRCTPDDRQTGYKLAQWLFEQQGFEHVAVLRSSDRYGRMGVKEFRDAARRLGRPLPMEVLFAPGQADFRSQLERLERSGFDSLVVWSKAPDAARILVQMRALGLTQPVFGTDRMISKTFLELAGDAAEGVIATAWMDPTATGRLWADFQSRFRARFGSDADVFAARGYDAGVLVVEAVRSAGLDRTLIRDALLQLPSATGVAGEMRFDATSNNLAPLFMVGISGGKFVLR